MRVPRLAPGNKESAGKRIATRTRQGNHSLKSAMVEAAWAASHTKGTFLAARFQRLAKRLKGKKAVVAVAHLMIEIIYHMLECRTDYQEKGADYYVEMDRKNTEKWVIRRLEELGYAVNHEPRVKPVA